MTNPIIDVLIISRDQAFLAAFRQGLRQVFNLVLAADERIILNLSKSKTIPLAIVDLDSYVENSLQLLKSSRPPIKSICISQDFTPDLDIFALEQGTDISMIAPRDVRQLIFRILSLTQGLVVKKTAPSLPYSRPTEPIQFAGLMVYPNEHVVRRGNDLIQTTPTQFRLLVAFLSQPNHLLTRQWLKERIWADEKISLRSIDAQVSKLKKTLPELENRLVNIYGEGYILDSLTSKTA